MSDKPTEQNLNDMTLILEGQNQTPATSCEKAYLIVLTGTEIGRKISLAPGEHVIGRMPSASICIPASSVSRQHARLLCTSTDTGRRAEITDLNSSNGTRVNNERVERAELKDGDKIQLGDVVLKFSLEDPVDEAFLDEVHRRIHYNELTGLLALSSFRNQLSTTLQRAASGTTLVLAMTDLDGLKKVNDTYGHLAGAKTIQTMGATMRGLLRPQDRAGLYGGDEAILYYPETTLEQAKERAEQLREAIKAMPLELDGHAFGVTISQGLAEWPTHGTTVDQLIAAADGALYAAKAAGRNCVRCVGE